MENFALLIVETVNQSVTRGREKGNNEIAGNFLFCQLSGFSSMRTNISLYFLDTGGVKTDTIQIIQVNNDKLSL